MENLFDLRYGVAGVCVMLTLLVLVEIAKAFFAMRERQETISESTMQQLISAVQDLTYATKHLDTRMISAEKAISEFPKVNNDIRRFYAALKALAGDRWTEIKEGILEDKLL